MAKEKELESVVAKLILLVKNLQGELKILNEKFGKYTDAYCEGIKEGIDWAEKHK